MKRFLLLICLLLLAGCDVLRGINLPEGFPAIPGVASPTPVMTSTAPATATTPAPALTPTATPVPSLVLWVPPQFAPDSSTPAGNLLKKRLDDFSKENGGVQVTVRVKAESGTGSLLESLSTASEAAPLTLPSVVALDQADLETAALKGLVYDIDKYSKTIEGADWYDYARQLARVQGAAFGLPFAGDALVLAYRPAQIKLNTPLADWNTVLRMNQPLGFPAGDPQALFVLSLYLSNGGSVVDNQRRPALEADKLSQVFQIYSDGGQRGIFPYWLSQYETGGQVWQAYKDERVNALVTWTSTYLSNLPADTTAVPVPPMGKGEATLATGWSWTVADPDPDHRAMSVRLAEYLSDNEFLAKWTEAAGYLPTRPSVLDAWQNQSLKSFLGQVAVAAQTRPTEDEISSIGPVLKDALLKVLKHENDPTQAAKAASEKLAAPETQ